jgi:hypothetical protein
MLTALEKHRQAKRDEAVVFLLMCSIEQSSGNFLQETPYYNEIRRTVEYSVALDRNEYEALRKAQQRNIQPERGLVGTPSAIRQRLRELEEAGAQEVIIYLQDAAQLESVRLFAQECILR